MLVAQFAVGLSRMRGREKEKRRKRMKSGQVIQHAARHFPWTSATAHKRGGICMQKSRRIEAGVDTHVPRISGGPRKSSPWWMRDLSRRVFRINFRGAMHRATRPPPPARRRGRQWRGFNGNGHRDRDPLKLQTRASFDLFLFSRGTTVISRVSLQRIFNLGWRIVEECEFEDSLNDGE